MSRDPYSVNDFVKKFASGDLEFEPGSKYNYNNSGYFLLGAIIEKVTGKPYETVLKERIFEPLGMTNTGYDHHAPILQKRAAVTKKLQMVTSTPLISICRFHMPQVRFIRPSKTFTNGSSRFMKIRFFPPKAKNDVHSRTFQLRIRIRIFDQTIGKSDQKTKVIQHGGGINGFNSLLTRVVDKQQTVILLDNVGLGRYHGQHHEFDNQYS